MAIARSKVGDRPCPSLMLKGDHGDGGVIIGLGEKRDRQLVGSAIANEGKILGRSR